jgi:hypothetical protein
MTACCPLCHQPLGTLRFGVRLPAFKAALIDAIKRTGDIGISSAELIAGELYRDRKPVQLTTIKSHICQLNDLLTDTDWRVASDCRRWFLRHRQSWER